jgi:multisubunit Na+/H+ antiporter MnhG subunit
VKPINAGREDCATLRAMSILTSLALIGLTLAAAYMLWSLLLRADSLYTRLESHGQTAADVAGVAFFGLATVIVCGALAALRIEARLLIGALLH